MVLNGVMMGLTPKQMRRRLDAVLDFAELREFAGLKLKNYSSGMLVRLAFSVMMEADADVLLIDEVLAVGDASFQQKCADAFHQMKAAGKTIVLVTHAMSTVEEYCHRAMLISDGRIAEIGEPHEVGRNTCASTSRRPGYGAHGGEGEEETAVRMLEARIVDAEGERTSSVEHGEEMRIQIEIEAREDFAALGVSYMLVNANGIGVSQLRAPIGGEPPRPIKAGERFKIETTIPNLLAPGHYFVHCGINRVLEGGVAIDVPSAIDFVVYGGPTGNAAWSRCRRRRRPPRSGAAKREQPAAAALTEVRGPSAVGGGWQRFFDLLWLLSVTEFKRVYFGTVLGYLWSLIRPLMLFGVLLFVFTQVFKVGSEQVEHYPVMLLMGIVLFTFFQESTSNAVNSVATQEGVVRKTQFPRLVIPLATVLTGFFNFCLNLVVVFAFLLAFGVEPAWSWLLFPVALALILVFTAALSMALSVLYVRFRDMAIIWVVVAQVLFYATPILYPITAFENDRQEHLLLINPLAVIFQQVRVWVLHEPRTPTYVPNINTPRPTEAAGGSVHLLPATAIFLAVCAFGIWIFRREAPRIAEDL